MQAKNVLNIYKERDILKIFKKMLTKLKIYAKIGIVKVFFIMFGNNFQNY